MIWTVLGWALWAFVALFALASLAPHSDRAVQWMKRKQSLILTIALALTFGAFPKWHLLWVLPVSQIVPMLLMQSRVNRIGSHIERVMLDAKQRGEDPLEAMKKETERITNV